MVSLVRQNATFRLLLGARLISSLGDWFTYMLLVVLAYQRTGRAADAMGILASQAAATLLFSFFAGPLTDRRHPAWVMAAADIARTALVGALFLVPVSPGIYATAAFLTAAAAAYFNPAEDKWVMLTLTPAEYPAGAALRQVLNETTKILGPSLAVTALALIGSGHHAVGFLLDAGSFLFSAMLIARAARRQALDLPPAPPAASGRPWREWQGLGPTLALPAVQTLVAVLLAVLLGLGGIDVVLLAFVRDALHLSSLNVGYLITALAIGVIGGTLASQWAVGRLPPWIWLGCGLGGLGLFFGLAPAAPVLALSLGSMAATGFFNGVLNVNLAPYLQTIVPVGVAGRFYSLLGTLASLAAVLGMVVNSVLLAAFGPGPTMGMVGGWITVAGILGAVRLGRAQEAPAAGGLDAPS